jgi:hypothetical protein
MSWNYITRALFFVLRMHVENGAGIVACIFTAGVEIPNAAVPFI